MVLKIAGKWCIIYKGGIVVRIYLDNCCYNRPYDDQNQVRVSIETEAVLYIQNLIKSGEIELVTSYMLDFENDANSSTAKKKAIDDFMKRYETVYVGTERTTSVNIIAKDVIKTGVKTKDAVHVSCAILTQCDFFISTDNRLLKYKDERIRLVSPCEFIRLYKEEII